jgi:hypothetical protein
MGHFYKKSATGIISIEGFRKKRWEAVRREKL